MYIGKIKKYMSKMQKTTKFIISVGIALTFLSYLTAFVFFLLPETLFGDYTTGLYWSEQCTLLAKELLGATVVPALIFEIVLNATGKC